MVSPQLEEEAGAAAPHRWSPHHDVRTLREPGATVLLDGAAGRFFKLNAAGTCVWEGLAAGRDRAEILRGMQARFQVPEARLSADLDILLAELHRRRLIVRQGAGKFAEGAGDSAGADAAAARTTASARETPASRARPPEPSEPSRHSEPAAARAAHGRQAAPRPAGVAVAYAALLLADLLLRGGGYRRFRRRIAGWPVARTARRPVDPAKVCGEVDTAASYYFKRAWCLQRSAAATCLLRRAAMPAHLVIGVREVPFMSHAWVEVDGRVINDTAAVRRVYREIDRF